VAPLAVAVAVAVAVIVVAKSKVKTYGCTEVGTETDNLQTTLQ